MKILLIDDFRENIHADKIARTFEQGIECLKNEYWDLLLLDHDLCDEDPRKTGYGIMCWLEQNQNHLPGRIEFVTANPVGRKNMERVRINLYEKI